MITKQQRIQLRSLASTIKPTVWVGKDGFDLNVYEQIKQELFNHELIKISLKIIQSVGLQSTRICFIG